MDPASIAGLATTAIGVATTAATKLADLKAAIPRIGETVEGLQIQVTGMQQILISFSDVIDEPGLESHLRHADPNLTEWIPRTVKNCEVILRRIKNEADQIQTSKKPGLVGHTLMAVKYQWSKNEIRDLLDHIKMHSMNLQIATNTVNLRRALPAHELMEKLERMEQTLEAMNARMEQNLGSAALANDRYLMNIKVNDCTAPLLQSAARAVSSGMSATGRHSSGARSVLNGQPAFQFIDEAVCRRSRTAEWLHTITPLVNTVDLPVSKPNSHVELPPKSMLGISEFDHRPPKSPRGARQQFYIPSDEDRSISLENVTTMFQEGEQLANQGRWMEADQELIEAFKGTRKLSAERQENLRLLERRILHGRCKMELGEYEAADAILTEITHSHGGASQDMPMVLRARYIFAQLNLQCGKHNTAGEYCREALNGQEAVLGEKHEDCFASSALLSKIMLAKGDPIQARNFARRLPNNMRAQHVQELNEFATSVSQLKLFPGMGSSLAGYASPYFKLRESNPNVSPVSNDSPGKHIYISTAVDFRERGNSASSATNKDNGFYLLDDIDDKSTGSRALASEDDFALRPVYSHPVEDSIAETFQRRSLSMASTAVSATDQTIDMSAAKPVPLITPSSLRYDEFVQSKSRDSEQWYHAVEIQAKKFNGENWDRLPPFMKIEHRNGNLSLEVGRMNFAHFKGANHPCKRLNEPFFHQVAFWKDGSEPTCECTIEFDHRSHGWCFQSVAGYAWLNGEYSTNGRALLREDFRVYLSSSQDDTTPSLRRSSWITKAKDVEFKVLLLDVQLTGDPYVGYWLKARRDFR